MRTTHAALSAVCALCITCLAQIPDSIWTRTYITDCFRDYSHLSTTYGGVALGGASCSRDSASPGIALDDISVVRLNAQYDSLWTFVYGKFNANDDLLMAMCGLRDGGVILGVRSDGPGDGNFLIKLDPNGVIAFADTLPDKVIDIEQNGDDGFTVLCGSDNVNGDVLYHYLNDGTIADSLVISGSPFALSRAFCHTDTSYFFAGEFNYLSYPEHCIYVGELPSSGTFSGGYFTSPRSYANNISRVSTGFLVSGSIDTTSATVENYLDGFFIKTDQTGLPEWTLAYDDPSCQVSGNAGVELPDGRFLLAMNSYAGSLLLGLVQADGRSPMYRSFQIARSLGQSRMVPALNGGALVLHYRTVASLNRDRMCLYLIDINNPPYFDSQAPATTATPGVEYRQIITAQDSFPGDAIRYRLAGLPPQGMTIDSLTGQMRWTPTESDTGDHEISVEAVDRLGQSDEHTYTLNVSLSSHVGRTPHAIPSRGRTVRIVGPSGTSYSQAVRLGMGLPSVVVYSLRGRVVISRSAGQPIRLKEAGTYCIEARGNEGTLRQTIHVY